MTMYLSALLVGVVAMVLCQPSNGGQLCTPDQWEGIEVINTGYVHELKPGTIREHRKLYYDAKNKRTARFVTYINGAFEDQFQIVNLYGEKDGIQYMADLKKGTCYTETFLHPFEPDCIPDDMKMIDSYHLGLKTSAMAVNTYTEDKKHGKLFVSIFKAGDNIIPISETFFGHQVMFGTQFFQSAQYGDIAPGISNTTVFEIPKECHKEQDLTVVERLMSRQRQHSMFGF